MGLSLFLLFLAPARAAIPIKTVAFHVPLQLNLLPIAPFPSAPLSQITLPQTQNLVYSGFPSASENHAPILSGVETLSVKGRVHADAKPGLAGDEQNSEATLGRIRETARELNQPGVDNTKVLQQAYDGLSAHASMVEAEQPSPSAVGPKLRIVRSKLPVQLPLRKNDGTLFVPEAVFSDQRESDAVLKAVDNYLALKPEDPESRHQEAFLAITRAAEQWAEFTAEPFPGQKSKTTMIMYLKRLGKRILQTPFVTTFHEFYDDGFGFNGLERGGEAGYAIGWMDTWKAWARVLMPENILSVSYHKKYKRTPFDLEVVRIHEWTHVADEARMGFIDSEGRRGRWVNKQFETDSVRQHLFTEVKAYALSFFLEKNLEKYLQSSRIKTAAAQLGKEDITFAEYFLHFLKTTGLYPWAEDLQTGNIMKIESMSKSNLNDESMPKSNPNDEPGIVIGRKPTKEDRDEAVRGIKYIRTIMP